MSEKNDYFDDGSMNEFQEWFRETCFDKDMKIGAIIPDIEHLMKSGESSIVRDLAYQIHSGNICTFEDYINNMTRVDYSSLLFLMDFISSAAHSGDVDEYASRCIISLQQIVILLLMLEDYYITFSDSNDTASQMMEFILRFEYMLKYDDDQYTFFPLSDEEPNAY